MPTHIPQAHIICMPFIAPIPPPHSLSTHSIRIFANFQNLASCNITEFLKSVVLITIAMSPFIDFILNEMYWFYLTSTLKVIADLFVMSLRTGSNSVCFRYTFACYFVPLLAGSNIWSASVVKINFIRTPNMPICSVETNIVSHIVTCLRGLNKRLSNASDAQPSSSSCSRR